MGVKEFYLWLGSLHRRAHIHLLIKSLLLCCVPESILPVWAKRVAMAEPVTRQCRADIYRYLTFHHWIHRKSRL